MLGPSALRLRELRALYRRCTTRYQLSIYILMRTIAQSIEVFLLFKQVHDTEGCHQIFPDHSEASDGGEAERHQHRGLFPVFKLLVFAMARASQTVALWLILIQALFIFLLCSLQQWSLGRPSTCFPKRSWRMLSRISKNWKDSGGILGRGHLGWTSPQHIFIYIRRGVSFVMCSFLLLVSKHLYNSEQRLHPSGGKTVGDGGLFLLPISLTIKLVFKSLFALLFMSIEQQNGWNTWCSY